MKIIDGYLKLVISVIIVILILYFRDIEHVHVGKYIITAVIATSIMLLNFSQLTCYLLFLIPLLSGLPGNFILPIFIIKLLMNSNKKNISYVFFALITVFELFHYLFYDFEIYYANVLGYLSCLFVLNFYGRKNENIDDVLCIKSFILGVLVLFVFTFLIAQDSGGLAYLAESSIRIGYNKMFLDSSEGVMMLSVNPNTLGIYSVFGIALVLVLYSTKHINVITLVLATIILGLIGSFSISRTWLLSMVILVATVVYFILFKSDFKHKTFLLISVAILFIALTYMFINSTSFAQLQIRLDDDTMSTAGGRTSLFRTYNEFLFNNIKYLFFGTGAVYYANVVGALGIFNASHNGLQQILIAYGIIGFLVFVYYAIKCFKHNYNKNNRFAIIPFIILLLMVQTSQLLTPHDNLYLFLIAFLAMRIETKQTQTR